MEEEVDYHAVFAARGSNAKYLITNADYAVKGVGGPHYMSLAGLPARTVFTDLVGADVVFQHAANDGLTTLEFVRLKAAADVEAGRVESPWRLINEVFVKVCNSCK
jgi:hypothetical protein